MKCAHRLFVARHLLLCSRADHEPVVDQPFLRGLNFFRGDGERRLDLLFAPHGQRRGGLLAIPAFGIRGEHGRGILQRFAGG